MPPGEKKNTHMLAVVIAPGRLTGHPHIAQLGPGRISSGMPRPILQGSLEFPHAPHKALSLPSSLLLHGSWQQAFTWPVHGTSE